MTHPDCEGLRKALEMQVNWRMRDGTPCACPAGRNEDEPKGKMPTMHSTSCEYLRAALASPPAPCEGCGKKDEALRLMLFCVRTEPNPIAHGWGEEGEPVEVVDTIKMREAWKAAKAAISPAPAKQQYPDEGAEPMICPYHDDCPPGKECAPAKPSGKCCDNGNFFDGHYCQKQPGDTAPAKPCAEVTLTEEERHDLEIISRPNSGPVQNRMAALIKRLLGQGETK